MFQSILVLLDGTRFAESAVPLATSVGRSTGANVRLLMAYVSESPLVGVGEMPIWSLPDRPNHIATAQEYLAEAAERFGAPGRPLVAELIEGDPGPALAERITAQPPDLVVMASHGRGPLTRMWLGSVSDYLVRHVSVPLLLVRPDESFQVDADCRRILVTLDLSEQSAAVLEPAAALARAYGAGLTLLHILEPAARGAAPSTAAVPASAGAAAICRDRMRAQHRLDCAAEPLRKEGLDVATRVELGSSVAGALLDLMHTERFDVVAITTHGRSGWQRAMLGSVADKLIRFAGRPVLVLRPGSEPWAEPGVLRVATAPA